MEEELELTRRQSVISFFVKAIVLISAEILLVVPAIIDPSIFILAFIALLSILTLVDPPSPITLANKMSIYIDRTLPGGAPKKELPTYSAEDMAELIVMIAEAKVNSSAAQRILEQMYKTGGEPHHIADEQNLLVPARQITPLNIVLH